MRTSNTLHPCITSHSANHIPSFTVPTASSAEHPTSTLWRPWHFITGLWWHFMVGGVGAKRFNPPTPPIPNKQPPDPTAKWDSSGSRNQRWYHQDPICDFLLHTSEATNQVPMNVDLMFYVWAPGVWLKHQNGFHLWVNVSNKSRSSECWLNVLSLGPCCSTKISEWFWLVSLFNTEIERG